MGCSTSRLEDEEAVQLCKDRKRFIKQAVEQRTRFASGHLAYIQSLKRVSAALRDYVDGDEPREFLLDSFINPPFAPVKKTSPGFISISPTSVPRAAIHPATNSTFTVNYLKSGGNQAVVVEERPQSPETVRMEAYSPIHQYGMDGYGYFGGPSWPMSSSFFSYSPSPNRPSFPPCSPQTSQWDGFWNPFSSLDYYGYPTQSSLDHMVVDDDIRGVRLRQVREEEGIPDLEDESEQEEMGNKANANANGNQKQPKVDAREEVIVEDVDEDEEDEDEDEDEDDETDCECEHEHEHEQHEMHGLQSQGSAKVELSRAQNSRQLEGHNQQMAVGGVGGREETPAFTVYVNRRPTSMAEVIKDLEKQFSLACDSAKEVSTLLESSKAQYSSTTSNELTAMKMLNPVALIRSASSRSSSSRFLLSSSSYRDGDSESSSDFSEEFSDSHQSTLDRLYIWEKKLFEVVKSGEKVRIAYEKKQMQLRNQDVQGEDPTVVDKTRLALRDLYTQLQVYVHSAEAVSKRIEALRDDELQPQLFELVQGLGRMWKAMAECHRSQKQTLDEAKLLLAGTPSKLDARRRQSSIWIADPQRLARSASNLEAELRNWRACFEAWITSQRSYLHALSGWLLRCVRSDTDTSRFPFSPRRSSGTFPIFGICIQWSRLLDAVQEIPVLDGLDFFAAGMGSLYAQQRDDNRHHHDHHRSASRRHGSGLLSESEMNMEIVEVGEVEEVVMTAEKMAEVAVRVLCAGMSVTMSSLSEFAASSADGYEELVKQWKNVTLAQSRLGQ
ncbi:hypothetical protein M5689_023074 [Euphorbia peplus]|nr:hypothetical protein M5689_023074 [Euphorbia peplus]